MKDSQAHTDASCSPVPKQHLQGCASPAALPWQCMGHGEVMLLGHHTGAWAGPLAQLAVMQGDALVCAGVCPV